MTQHSLPLCCLFLAVCFNASLMGDDRSPQVPPAGRPLILPHLSTSPMSKTSVFRFEIEVPLEQIKTRLDKEFPREVHWGLQGSSVGRNGLREQVPNHDILINGKKMHEACWYFPTGYGWAEKGGTWGPPGFQYYIYRHPISTQIESDGSIRLSTDLDFKVAIAINYDTGAFYFKPWVFAETGFGGEWPRTLAIAVTSRIQPTDQFGLKSDTEVIVTPKTEIVLSTLHGVVRRDATPEVMQLMKRQSDELASLLDQKLSAFNFKPQAQQAWSLLHSPVNLGGGLYANITPKGLQLGSIQLKEKHAVVPCAIVADIRISDKPHNLKVIELPALQIIDPTKEPQRFEAEFGMELTKEFMQSELRKAFANKIDLGGDNSLEVLSSEIRFDAGKVQLVLGSAVLRSASTNFNGALSIFCSPRLVVDESRYFIELRPSGLRVVGNGFLDKIKALAIEPVIARELTKVGRVEVTKDVTRELAKLGDGVHLSDGIDMRFHEVRVMPSERISIDKAGSSLKSFIAVSGFATALLNVAP